MTVSEERILYAESLDVGYEGKAVVREVSFGLHPGEIIALIGPNGTGKSTILKTLSGQIPPVGGSVFLKGKDIRTLPEKELSRTMSLLMTERVDPELMTCEDVISIGRYPYTGVMGRLSAHDREVVEEAMEMSHVLDLRNRFFSQISDGQKQRVLLARAICQEPEVLIMDEPTSFLDIRHKLELLQILLKLVREQKVAVMVSLHEIELARKVADRVMCVKEGKAEAGKTPAEVFSRDSICRLFDITGEQYQWLYDEA